MPAELAVAGQAEYPVTRNVRDLRGGEPNSPHTWAVRLKTVKQYLRTCDIAAISSDPTLAPEMHGSTAIVVAVLP